MYIYTQKNVALTIKANWCQLSDNKGAKSDRIFYLFIIYLIRLIFAKLRWAVFWIPKLNLCFKFVYKNASFVFFRNAALNFWSIKANSFNTVSSSAHISWLSFIPWVIWIFNFLNNVFHTSRRWIQLSF